MREIKELLLVSGGECPCVCHYWSTESVCLGDVPMGMAKDDYHCYVKCENHATEVGPRAGYHVDQYKCEKTHILFTPPGY